MSEALPPVGILLSFFSRPRRRQMQRQSACGQCCFTFECLRAEWIAPRRKGFPATFFIFGTTMLAIVGEGKAMHLFNQNGPPPRSATESASLSRDQLRQRLLALILKNEALRNAKPR
jgi:hypothetical protein